MARRILIFTGCLLVWALTPLAWADRPAWLTTQPPAIQAFYTYAQENRDWLQYVPCYCGCGSPHDGGPTHHNVADCYYNPETGYDRMGTACGVCIAIVHQARMLKESGWTLSAIRATVDSTHRATTLNPTPTPQPLGDQ